MTAADKPKQRAITVTFRNNVTGVAHSVEVDAFVFGGALTDVTENGNPLVFASCGLANDDLVELARLVYRNQLQPLDEQHGLIPIHTEDVA